MPNKKTTINPWHFNGKPVTDIKQFPEGAIGFVYRIDLLDGSGRYYYGRKTCVSTCRKKLTIKEKLLQENSRKTFKITTKESNWKTYNGSCKPLLEDIKNGAKVKKTIIDFCFSKAELTYKESSLILCTNSLLDSKSYNNWITCKIFKSKLIEKE